MPKNKKEGSSISFPWDESKPRNKIVCPECQNDGMDGTITAQQSQYGLTRICRKCNHRWSGGIGVQRADFSEPMPIKDVEKPAELDTKAVQFTGAPHRAADHEE